MQYVFAKWFLAFLIGLLTGLIATVINLAVENIAGYKLLVVVEYIEQKRYRLVFFKCIDLPYISNWEILICDLLDLDGGRYLMGFIYMAVANLLLTLVAAVLCVCFAPTAAGPGIPEIKAYLNGVDTPNMFGATTLIVKVPFY